MYVRLCIGQSANTDHMLSEPRNVGRYKEDLDIGSWGWGWGDGDKHVSI